MYICAVACHKVCYRVLTSPLSLSLSLSLSLTHTHTEVEELGNKELELGDKTIIIEIKANEQGKFVKILEVRTNVCTSLANIKKCGFRIHYIIQVSLFKYFVSVYTPLPSVMALYADAYRSLISCHFFY